MTAKVRYEVTSDQAGQIPAIGTFNGSGEDVVRMSEAELRMFEVVYGCKLAAANFPHYVHVTMFVEPAPVEEPANVQAGSEEEEVKV